MVPRSRAPAALALLGLPWIALAEGPGPPPLAVPPDLGVTVLGGADAWTGGGGAAAELRAGASARGRRAEASLSGALEAVDDAGTGLVALDQLRAGAWIGAGGGLPLGAGAAASGSVASGWLDATTSLGLEARRGGLRAQLTAGGGLRAARSPILDAPASVGPEGLASARLDLRHGLLGATTTTTGRLLGGPLPPALVDAGQWLSVGGRHRVELGAVLSAVPTSDALPVAGLPAPGTTVLQGLLAGELGLAERWTLRLEVGPEVAWGALPYERVRALGGLRGDLGRRGPVPPDLTVTGRTRFELRAADAEEVELLAGFNGWRPLPMAREGRVWVVEVDVPPGSWEFTFRVDGALVVPPAAERYVPDGFGGTNGVAVVP